MSDVYNNEVSKHYAAYRPPVHKAILESILPTKSFKHGLDIGCGTGVSTIALAPFCANTTGIDPSQSMLEQAQPAANIQYLQGSSEHVPAESQSVDVVTFAGSLSYAKSDQLIDELKRVCQPNAWVVVYDFEVLLDSIMAQINAPLSPRDSEYKHAENFEGNELFLELESKQKPAIFTMNSTQLAHVLFSSSRRYTELVKQYGDNDTFNLVVAQLDRLNPCHDVVVDVYSSVYQLNG